MQIAFFGRAAEFIASGRPINVAEPWSECLEDWVHTIDSFLVTADHHAVASLQPPDSAARSDVQIVNAGFFEMRAASAIVSEIGITTINNGVVRLEMTGKFIHDFVGDGCRDHDPGVSGSSQFRGKVRKRASTDRSFARELLYRFWMRIEDDALVTMFHETPDHVGAHPAETDHS